MVPLKGMTTQRSTLKGLAGLVALGIPTLFMFAVPLSVAVFLFGFGKKLLMPETFWSDEVAKIEASISVRSRAFRDCQEDAIKQDSASADLYATFLKQGMSSDQAIGLVQSRRVGLSRQCDMHLAEMIPLATKLSQAKEELAKHSK